MQISMEFSLIFWSIELIPTLTAVGIVSMIDTSIPYALQMHIADLSLEREKNKA